MSETTNSPQEEDGAAGTFVGGSFGADDAEEGEETLAADDLVQHPGGDGGDEVPPGERNEPV